MENTGRFSPFQAHNHGRRIIDGAPDMGKPRGKTSAGAGKRSAYIATGSRKRRTRFRGDPRTVWICGGAALYKAALPECSELILSRVKMSPQGDVFFPDFSDLFEEKEIILENELFDVIKYTRK